MELQAAQISHQNAKKEVNKIAEIVVQEITIPDKIVVQEIIIPDEIVVQ